MNFGLDEDGNAVSQPLDDLKSLIEWQPPEFKVCCAGNSLHHRHEQQASRNLRQTSICPKVLLCHDMAGGYLDDRFIQGCPKTPAAYMFYHWHLIDTFVYFSHRFVTVPPSGWILAAHKHGVNILGTIITEWDKGAALCKEMLQSLTQVNELTTKLADMASFFGFDGWLINIENKIEPEQIPLLQTFVQQLTEKCHAQLQYGTVLWYDSVICTGELKWQDELNTNNEMFFKVCDGIFLNYGITTDKLTRSREKAFHCNRQCDVYVGIDVFGRGSPGGGGFNCKEALEMITRQGLSCALFAPGWVMEKLGPLNFHENNILFWSLLSDLLRTRPTSLPLSTSFCRGEGEKYFSQGEVLSDAPWFNLSLQQVQPSFTNSQFMPHSLIKKKVFALEGKKEIGKDAEISPSPDRKQQAETELPHNMADTGNVKCHRDTPAEEGNVEASVVEHVEMPISSLIDRKDDPVPEGTSTALCIQNSSMINNSGKMNLDASVGTGTEYSIMNSNKTDTKKDTTRVEQKGPNMSVDLSCGYNGGGCLRLEAWSVNDQPVIFKLYNICNIEQLKQLSVTWKTRQTSSCHFGLLLSPASKKPSLENALVLFETSISTTAAHWMYQRMPKAFVHIMPDDQGTRAIDSWQTRIHTIDAGSFCTERGNPVEDVTLSAVLLNNCNDAGTSSSGQHMCIWLGQIKAITTPAITKNVQQPVTSNLHCLKVVSGPKLSCSDLEQIVMNPCFKEDETVCSSLSQQAPDSGSKRKIETKELSLNIVEKARKLDGGCPTTIYKELILSCDNHNTNGCKTLYLLKWDSSNLTCVDHFVVYLISDAGSREFLGFSSSNYFVYHSENELKSMSFFIQPIFSV